MVESAFLLALGAWVLGLTLGFVGACRHALLWLAYFALRLDRFGNVPAPPAAPGTRPDRLQAPPTTEQPPVERTVDEIAREGRVRARGQCLLCFARWGACEHTRNA